MIRRLKAIVAGIVDGLTGTVKNVTSNWEAITILSLSGIGLTKVLTELPFQIMLPLWLEGIIASSAILPVVSVFTILMLVASMKWRLGL